MAENKGLKTEIATIVTKACIHFEHGDEEYTYGAIRQILAKIREVVEGVDIENPYPEDTGQYNGFNAGINLLTKAILKALDKED